MLSTQFTFRDTNKSIIKGQKSSIMQIIQKGANVAVLPSENKYKNCDGDQEGHFMVIKGDYVKKI